MSRRRNVTLRIAAVLLMSGVLAPGALAARSTTGPGSRLEIYVFLTQHQVRLAVYALSDYSGANELYLIPLEKIVRGDTVFFTIVNRTTTPHDFSLLGKTTPILQPGGRARFTVELLARGIFPYVARSAGKTKDLTGTFVVY